MPGPIAEENGRPGSSGWRLVSPAKHRALEAFVDRSSYAVADSVSLFVSGVAGAVTGEVFRLGHYGGSGGRLVGTVESFDVEPQAPPVTDGRGAARAPWLPTTTFRLSDDAVSGCYVVVLTAASGAQTYAPFVVRDDAAIADFLVVRPDLTDQAYNGWGRMDLYGLGPDRANAVSYDRPYEQVFGSGHVLLWDLAAIRWLESQGLDVTYVSSIALHRRPIDTGRHRALVSLGHDEYWTYEMRSHVEAAHSDGLSLVVLGANACYWQVRLEASAVGANRTVLCYKNAWLVDGGAVRDRELPPGHARQTTTWRSTELGRPEQNLLGVMFSNYMPGASEPFVARSTGAWPYTGTGVPEGQAFDGVMGYEVDSLFENGDRWHELTSGSDEAYEISGLEQLAPGTERIVLGASPLSQSVALPPDRDAHTVLLRRPGGAKVFASGTMDWAPAILPPTADSLDIRSNLPVAGLGHHRLARLTSTLLRNARAGQVAMAELSDGLVTLTWEGRYSSTFPAAPVLDHATHTALGRFLGPDDHQLFIAAAPLGNGPRACLIEFAADGTPAVRHWEPSAASGTLFTDWTDPEDRLLAGDFLGRGHDQLLLINNDTTPPATGRVSILDFTGTLTQDLLLTEPQAALFHQWTDPEDQLLAGDFLGRGHDQLLLINNDTTPPATGRVSILDFTGTLTQDLLLTEPQAALFHQWTDPEDQLLAGDFLGRGHDQLLLINNDTTPPATGRVSILDFTGTLTQDLLLTEPQAALFHQWTDPEDQLLAGDFLGRGHDQLLLINNDTTPPATGRVSILDLSGTPSQEHREDDGDNPALDGWTLSRWSHVTRHRSPAAALFLPH